MNKELKKYVTDELLLIANNVTGEYTDKQVQQAKLELYNRGVDDKIIADINGGKCSSCLCSPRFTCLKGITCQATSFPN